MNSVKVQLELKEDGDIDIKCSQPDAAMTLLILEKAKLKLIEGVNLKPKDGGKIIKPERRFTI